MNAQVLGISVDHVACLKAWADSLGGVSYPLLSDFWPHGRISELYGLLRPEGHSERAVLVIDRDGILRSVEVYPQDQQPENEDTWMVLAKLEPDAPPALIVKNTPPQVAIPEGGIIMYCTPWCADCRRARQWFQEQGIKITEVNVIQNPEADARVKAWGKGYRITPTFDIDGIIVVDFKLDKIKEALRERDLA